ncbi:MAG: hypothetical protein KIT34_00475 [Cyanobacteria bacterium TGS_CYA1]|nr:hypothetical protein [Cyanobacteria bacterium TGS_CYA1]
MSRFLFTIDLKLQSRQNVLICVSIHRFAPGGARIWTECLKKVLIQSKVMTVGTKYGAMSKTSDMPWIYKGKAAVKLFGSNPPDKREFGVSDGLP